MSCLRPEQLRVYSSLFTRAEIKAWQRNDFRNLSSAVDRFDGSFKKRNLTYRQYLSHVYNVLVENYATEYIVKNSFLNECLIPEINSHSATVFNEFRVGNSIADLAIFNGESKVFEIKTEFDSESRLKNQISDYWLLFNRVYIIIPESKKHFADLVGENTGVVVYNLKNRDKFRVLRESFFQRSLNHNILMEVLHAHEYKSIVAEYFGEMPRVSSFVQFETAKELIKKIPEDVLSRLFLNCIKKRKMSTALSSRYFREFNQLSLALKLDNAIKTTILNKLDSIIK